MNRESFPDAILRPHGFFAARHSAPQVGPLKLLASCPPHVLESKVERWKIGCQPAAGHAGERQHPSTWRRRGATGRSLGPGVALGACEGVKMTTRERIQVELENFSE